MYFSYRYDWCSLAGASISNLRNQISNDRVVVFVFYRFFWEDTLLFATSHQGLLLFLDDICQEAELSHRLYWF